MPSTKTTELRNMETEELETRLGEVRQEAFNLRFQLVTGQLDNYSRVGHVRREVARIETILREREIEAAEAAEIEAAGSAKSAGSAEIAEAGIAAGPDRTEEQA